MKTKVFNLIILDESGSMSCIKSQALNGLNETLQTIRKAQKKYPDQEQLVSIVPFESDNIRLLRDKVSIREVNDLRPDEYNPGACTPLFDAIGFGINSIRKQVSDDDSVLVTIITDGEENCSKEYSGKAIATIIDELKKKGWMFTYIGANQDAVRVAMTINITNALNFVQDEEGTKVMFEKERRSRERYFEANAMCYEMATPMMAREAKPKYVNDDVKGYYLQQIRDEKATPAWLHQTFRHFLLEENKILTEMREALAEYRLQLAAAKTGQPLDITLMHVGFAIAWFNQHESSEDRYLFFRSAYKHFMGFYSWPDEDLNDKDVASVLGITAGTLRTRTSRLCAKVKRLVNKLNDALIATLNKQSLDIAREIYAEPDPDMESILEELLGQSERDLEQYDKILALRKEKRLSIRTFEKFESACFAEEMCIPSAPCLSYDVSSPESHAQRQSKLIIRMFKDLIGM